MIEILKKWWKIILFCIVCFYPIYCFYTFDLKCDWCGETFEGNGYRKSGFGEMIKADRKYGSFCSPECGYKEEEFKKNNPELYRKR